jgi:uncharacterized protein with PIN domain
MSRLQTRISELERKLGRCPDCKPPIQIVHPGSTQPQQVSRCTSCGELVEPITVVFAFDLGVSES